MPRLLCANQVASNFGPFSQNFTADTTLCLRVGVSRRPNDVPSPYRISSVNWARVFCARGWVFVGEPGHCVLIPCLRPGARDFGRGGEGGQGFELAEGGGANRNRDTACGRGCACACACVEAWGYGCGGAMAEVRVVRKGGEGVLWVCAGVLLGSIPLKWVA